MLRGINLGKRRIKMDDIRTVFESVGCTDVATYVQRGNVVCRSKAGDLGALAKRIEKAIEQKFAFHSDVLTRTPAEMKDAIARNPFAGRKDVHPGKLLVTFLAAEPAKEAREQLRAIECAPDELHSSGRELYTYFPNGMARPKLKFAAVERAIKTEWTGRNWNTVTTLLKMAEELEASAPRPSPRSARKG